MKIVREMFNRSKDNWEFLTDDGHVLTKTDTNGHRTFWGLYEVAVKDVLDENWNGRLIWEYEADFYAEPADVLAVYSHEQDCTVECELFAGMDAATIGELHLAQHHIEAGDLRGALQHLAQFAAWTIQSYAGVKEAHELWEQFGPHYGRNMHLHIAATEAGWQLHDRLNERAYGPLCETCHLPTALCFCPDEPEDDNHFVIPF